MLEGAVGDDNKRRRVRSQAALGRFGMPSVQGVLRSIYNNG